MRRSVRVVAATGCLLLFYALPAAAQEADTSAALTPGRRSISATVFTRSGDGAEFGVWRMRHERLNRGLFIALESNVQHAEGTATTYWNSVAMGPRWRRYLRAAETVTPFVQTEAELRGTWRKIERAAASDESDWGAGVGAALAMGAEWFPARRVSVSAQTGARLTLDYQDMGPGETWNAGLQTFTSGISLQLYF